MNGETGKPACMDLDEYVKVLRGDVRNNRYKAGCLNEYLRFLDDRLREADPRKATPQALRMYALHVAAQPISASTKVTKLRLVLGWYRWMKQSGRIDRSPGEGKSPAGLLAEG